MQIAGSQVLITGATGGLGEAIARDLHRRGARLILSGRRRDALDGLAAELGAQAIAADLSDPRAVDELIAGAAQADILVANAGLPGSGRLESFTVEEIDRALSVNLRSQIALAHGLLPGMLERGRGHLLFMSSLAGKVSTPRSSIYNATKFGLRGFASALRADLHGSGVGVTVLMPSFVAEAGMFADSGAKLPPGVGLVSMEQVTEALAGAIEQNRGEVPVAPALLRLGAVIGQNAPGFANSMARRFGSERVAGRIASGQRPKR